MMESEEYTVSLLLHHPPTVNEAEARNLLLEARSRLAVIAVAAFGPGKPFTVEFSQSLPVVTGLLVQRKVAMKVTAADAKSVMKRAMEIYETAMAKTIARSRAAVQ